MLLITTRFSAIGLVAVALSMAGHAQDITPPPAPAEELRPVRPGSVDARFFALMDLRATGLDRTRALVEQEKYAEALEAWRDHSVAKMRGREAGKFWQHSHQLHPNSKATARFLLGDDIELKSEWLNSYRVYNFRGPPDPARKINWLATGGKDYSALKCLSPLVSGYQQTRDPVYLAKWFEIAGAFVVEQKRSVESLGEEERKKVQGNWDVRNHAVCLSAAARVHNLVKGVVGLAKALPDGNEPRPWLESLQPIDTPVAPDAINLIPAGHLADIAISLLFDHPPLMLRSYGKAGRTPNQRFTGLTGLALTARFFDEFHAGRAIGKTAGECLANYVHTTVLPDGGDLEQSFNYNGGLIREGEEIVAMFAEDPVKPKWVQLLHEAILKRERLFAGMTMPLGGVPKTGTNSIIPPPAAWQDERTRESWKKRMAKTVANVADPIAQNVYNHLFGDGTRPAPTFTSIAFPYSGYYAMRDGWNMQSFYLSFIASRIGSGHFKENINGIAITAYGRHLIVDGGPPPYGPHHLDESQRGEYEQAIAYFGERSSLTSNTITVDDHSQRRHKIRGAREAYTDPIAVRWHTSAAFDVAEGSYGDGYGGGKWGSAAPITVRHQRQIVFLRKQRLWLVTDRLTGDGKAHEYQQMWHFPPPHEQWNITSPGFLNSQVVTDAESRLIRTTDTSGPNIVLRHFSAADISYRRYFGQKKPWRGWFARAISGLKLPAVDVYACWKDTGGNTIVTTVLVPTPTTDDPVATATDLSLPNGTVSGCRLVLNDGTDVTWLAAREGITSLEAGTLKVAAEALLLVQTPNAPDTGIALGVKAISLADKPQQAGQTDFEFTVADSALRIIAPISYPAIPDKVELKPSRGLFVSPVTVAAHLPGQPGAALRYTLDGSEPTLRSKLYAGPITIAEPADLVVCPFRGGKPSGDPVRGRFEIRMLPPKPLPPDVHLSDLTPTKVKVGAFSLERDKCCYNGKPLRLNGRVHGRGIGIHANAEAVYPLKPEYRRFVAIIGLDDVTGTNGCIIFRVYAGNTLLVESPILEGTAQRFWYLDCPIPAGSGELLLKVDGGPLGHGWGMADWVDAGFVMHR
ncbi:MAG: hypothetical protein HN742_32175 [Lentisphaerae bacterium]|jgi:hypothetical protein|nr:hypothetical protein [Lentisphaerota bacterium]MBT4815184.1 hypothetical protein [Lentisphaerota bacterium]MBT5607105.1 hypothetical protein [Lentisphaerota bacterium]MBT7059222.1 hypothetical protein [Lentisphaerota bacterium]MBT7846571.1 hypothetical protein [Lentisphaerota bacterium]